MVRVRSAARPPQWTQWRWNRIARTRTGPSAAPAHRPTGPGVQHYTRHKRQIQQQHEKRTTCVGAGARECPLVHRGRARGMGYSAHRKEGRRRLRHEASDWCRRCAGAGGGCRRRSARSCRSEETCGWNQTERAHGIMLKRQIPFLSKRRVTSCRSTATQGIPPATVNRERRLATAPTMHRDRAIASAALPVRRLRASAVACR